MLTARNFAGLVSTSVTLGVLSTGFGAIDLVMIAPLGTAHVAAVGMGELIVAAVFAILFGYSDLFAVTLAQAEGSGTADVGLPRLLGVYSLTMLTISALFLAATLIVTPALAAVYPGSGLVWPISAYVIVRFATVGIFIVFVTSIDTLRIRGLRRLVFAPLLLGFVLNIAGNALFLYTPLFDSFWNPEAAVAAATVVAHFFAGSLALVLYVRRFPSAQRTISAAGWRAAKRQYPGFMTNGLSIGSRNLNDYIGNATPVLLVATMGAEMMAAAVVATRIATLFYRVPQACFSASLLFYGYYLGHSAHPTAQENHSPILRLLIYSAVPTVFAALLFLIFTSHLLLLFGGSIRSNVTVTLLLAYFVFLPAYFFEHFLGELLIAHQAGLTLFRLSTVATILIVIPFACWSVFYKGSAFLAIAGRGLGAVPLAVTYGLSLRSHVRRTRMPAS